MFLCPQCASASMKIELCVDLPPDDDWDERQAQLLRCESCGFEALAAYLESRRGGGDRCQHVAVKASAEQAADFRTAVATHAPALATQAWDLRGPDSFEVQIANR